jgi:nitroreductase
MNPKLSFIFSRRSVRKYLAKDIAPDVARDLLEAAMAAPSACCKDPWEFVVIRDKARLQDIAGALPNGRMLNDAPLGIAVCGDLRRAHGGELSYLLQDCSAAIENLLLAAAALGLGACWLGVHPREDRVTHLRRTLKIPDHVLPVAMIALGWPAETPPARSRYSDSAVHPETW